MSPAIHRLFHGILVTGVGNVITGLSNFLLITFLAITLGPSDLGVVSFVLALSVAVSTFGDFGSAQALPKYIQQREHSESSIIGAAFSLRFMASVALAAIVVAIDLTTDVFKGYGGYVAVIVAFSGFELVPVVYNARLEFRRSRGTQVLFAISYVAISVLLIEFGYGLVAALRGKILSLVLVGVPLFFIMCRNTGISVRRSLMAQIARFGALATAISIFTVIFTQSDVIMLMHLVGPSASGTYSVALVAASIVVKLLGSVVMVPLLPILSKHLAMNDHDGVAKIHRVLTRYLALLGLPIMIGGGVLAAPLIQHVFTSDYAPAISPFRILLVTQVITVMSIPLVSILYMKGNLRFLCGVAATTALLNIVGNLILIPRLGLVGAALSSVTTFLMGLVFELLWFRRHMALEWEYGRYVRFLIAAIIMGYAVGVLSGFSSSLASLVGIIVLGGSVYFGVALLLRGVSVVEIRSLRRAMQ